MAPSKHADEGGQLQHMEDDRMEEEKESFDSIIDELISQGINARDVKKLQDAGICTCSDLMKHSMKSFTGIKGLSEATVEKICEAAEKLQSQGFVTGSDLLSKALRLEAMAPSNYADEGGQLQLNEADRINEEIFESIDKLISQGINAGDVKKLQDAGIYTCNDLMKHSMKSLTGIKGLSKTNVEKICEAAEKLLSQGEGVVNGSDLLIESQGEGVVNGSDLLIEGNSVARITTGSQEIAAQSLTGAGATSRTGGGHSWDLLHRVKKFAAFTWRKMMDQRKHLDKAPMVAGYVGWVIDKASPVPVTPILVAGAESIKKINQTIDLGQVVTRKFRSTTPTDYVVVGTMGEAEVAINNWIDQGRPSSMVVDLAYGLTVEEASQINRLFTDRKAKDLLFANGWTVL